MINIFLIGKKGFDALSGLSKPQLAVINAVIIGKDNGVINDYSSNIEAFVQANELQYFFRTNTHHDVISKAQLNVAIGWRWLIPLEIPLIVFHDSILPKYRGFNPLVSALINGDKEIGVTALMGTDEFDKGPMVGQRIVEIQYPIKIEKAIERISAEYAILLGDVISEFIDSKTFQATPQDEAAASFSLWRDDEDYKINWEKDSAEIKRTIDAVGFPYKGAYSIMDGTLIRVFDAEILPDVNIVNRTPGKVIFKHIDGMVIVCGSGLLKVNQFFDDNGIEMKPAKFRIRFK